MFMLQLILPNSEEVNKEKMSLLTLTNDQYHGEENIAGLLKKFQRIFKEPPSRGHLDHRIPLQFGENPVNVRPYRYEAKGYH